MHPKETNQRPDSGMKEHCQNQRLWQKPPVLVLTRIGKRSSIFGQLDFSSSICHLACIQGLLCAAEFRMRSDSNASLVQAMHNG
jgi:hypothetical protein